LFRKIDDEFELETAEMSILEAAARQADVVAALEVIVAQDGLMDPTTGRVHPAVAEARQGRLALARLLAALALPDDDDVPRTARSRQAQRAAQVRWGAHHNG